MEQKSLKDLICERLEAKGLNSEKACQLTEIPKHYLDAVFRGEWQKLPAAPYARGYLKKLAAILEMDGNEVWSLYQNEAELIRVSGAGDRLPVNRFAIKKRGRKWIWPALATAVFAGYLILNVDRFLGRPQLVIESPLGAALTTSLSSFTISGKTEAKDKVFINGEEVYIDKNGQFQKDYGLRPGLNTFEILAKRFLGRETKVVKQIIYQSNEQSQKGK